MIDPAVENYRASDRGLTRFRNKSALGFALMFLLLTGRAELSGQGQDLDLSQFSLEDLSVMRVTSVSRRQEQLMKTASAVYVITQEDIRKSGATDIGDVLRMVPGMNVAQISSSKWAISARGFNAQWENKLLVMVDGRSVYVPSFSGVFWDMQDFVIEDIERIEVIRGPGATMWGANAVNGVISITTKHAADTQGGLLTLDAGTRRPGDGSLRYGGKAGTKAFYRVFATQTTRSGLPEASTGAQNDSWNLTHGGFRFDWKQSGKNDFTIDGDFLRAVTGARVNGVANLSPLTYRAAEHSGQRAGSIRTRWNRTTGADSNLTVQFYYENVNNYETFTTIEHLFDLDLQHTFNVGDRQKIIWGAGQRWATDRNINSAHMGYFPYSRHSSLSSAFVQDEVAVVSDRLYLTVGAKFEQNSYTGFEFEPTARITWLATDKRSVWAAVSRAVRTANRADRGFRTDIDAFSGEDPVAVLSVQGSPDSRSEGVRSHELGYRYQMSRRASIDIASFYSVYDHLATTEPGDPYFESEPSPSHLVYPLYFSNKMKGETYGAESSVSYQATSSFTLKGSYSLLRMQLHPYPDSEDGYAEQAETNSPRHQAHIGLSWNLAKTLQFATNTYFVSALPAWNIPARTRLDMNLRWRTSEAIDLSIIGQNLLNPTRPEFGEGEGSAASSMKASVLGRLSWRF